MEPHRDFLEEHERYIEGVIPHDLTIRALTNTALEGLVSLGETLEEEDD